MTAEDFYNENIKDSKESIISLMEQYAIEYYDSKCYDDMSLAWSEGYHRKVDEIYGGKCLSFNDFYFKKMNIHKITEKSPINKQVVRVYLKNNYNMFFKATYKDGIFYKDNIVIENVTNWKEI